MASLEYVQLVLLTERPGARIGRLPPEALTPEERFVADALELIRCFEAAYSAHRGDPLDALLRQLTAEQWTAATATLRALGSGWLCGRIRRVTALAGLQPADDAAARAQRLDALPERTRMAINRAAWGLVLAELHVPLMAFVLRHADAIPGAHDVPKAAS